MGWFKSQTHGEPIIWVSLEIWNWINSWKTCNVCLRMCHSCSSASTKTLNFFLTTGIQMSARAKEKQQFVYSHSVDQKLFRYLHLVVWKMRIYSDNRIFTLCCDKIKTTESRFKSIVITKINYSLSHCYSKILWRSAKMKSVNHLLTRYNCHILHRSGSFLVYHTIIHEIGEILMGKSRKSVYSVYK